MSIFDEILTPDERMEIAQSLGEITMTLWFARASVLNLHDFLTARFDGLPMAVDTGDASV